MKRIPNCPLCEADGGELVWMGDRARVILVERDRFPGFCRVVWNDHAAELTDLDDADQAWLMRLVARVERLVREVMTPDKVNLAALGNMVPQLHMHVIARRSDDAAWPGPVWGVGTAEPHDSEALTVLVDTLRMKIAELPSYSY